jgi:hypothetical protein
MKFATTLSNIEIVFWTIAIRLMKTRKLVRSVQLAFLVCIFLIAGALLTVAFAGRLDEPEPLPQVYQAAPSKSVSIPLRPVVNSQRNLLLIHVDRLQAETPRLRGVWLLVVLPSQSHVDFLPLYPASLSGGPVQDVRLEALFQLQADGSPSPAFLNAFRSMDFWWDHYLVLDEVALAGLIELVGGINLGEWPVNGKQAMDSLSLAFQEPRNAMVLQAVLAQELCHRIPRLLDNPEWVVRFDLLTDHVMSDFGLERSQVNWTRVREQGRYLVCEFPTLPEVSYTEAAD